VFAKAGLTYKNSKWQLNLYSLINGWKRIEDYSLSGEDNQQYATADGMPSWFTLNFKTAYNLNPKLQVQCGVENIFDKNYRQFASGVSAPGRSFFLTIRSNFDSEK